MEWEMEWMCWWVELLVGEEIEVWKGTREGVYISVVLACFGVP